MFPRTPYSSPREEVVVAAAKRQKAQLSAFCLVPPPSSTVLRNPHFQLKKAYMYVANWGLQIASEEGGLEWSKRCVFLKLSIYGAAFGSLRKTIFRKFFCRAKFRAKFINIG